MQRENSSEDSGGDSAEGLPRDFKEIRGSQAVMGVACGLTGPPSRTLLVSVKNQVEITSNEQVKSCRK